MSYPRMKTRVTADAGRVYVDVEHDPRQSYSRAVYPAAMRAVNSSSGRLALSDAAGACVANIRAVSLEQMDTDITETFDGRPVWRGGPLDGARSVTRYTFEVLTRDPAGV